MPMSRQFEIGYFVTQDPREHLFLSVSEGFEHGPGIVRDGVSDPHMSDPHSIAAVMHHFCLPRHELPATTVPQIQRAGTWTLYHHLKRFCEQQGRDWRIVGVQSNGDLTMNLWHVAFVNKSLDGSRVDIYGLRTREDTVQEPITKRTYRCLVKWTEQAAQPPQPRYEFIDLRFSEDLHRGWAVEINDPYLAKFHNERLKCVPGYDAKLGNIGPFIEFALSGKPIVENGIEISLANMIDRFDDVRHVFNLLTVKAEGYFQGNLVQALNFGEHQLYEEVNVRRAALFSPVVIDLKIGDSVKTAWEDVSARLKQAHYREISESPTRRGQFRRYSDHEIEIFFRHNVYPFGVLGIRPVEQDPSRIAEACPQQKMEIVGLSSGGLSGRVGNTLEATAQIMFDFFGCTHAMVLDEGFDVFSLINPFSGKKPKYTNEELLSRVLAFTERLVQSDIQGAVASAKNYKLGNDMREWPLNKQLFAEMEKDYSAKHLSSYADIVVVPPNRSQMRSVLIFAIAEHDL